MILYDTAEVCTMLKCSRPYVYKLVKNGLLKHIPVNGKTSPLKFTEQQVNDFLGVKKEA